MSIKNILVAYNGLSGSGAALHGAVTMQRFYDAHVTGLFAHGGSSLTQQIKPWMPQRVKDAIMEVADQSHREVLDTFNEICAPVPKTHLHWIDSAGPVQNTIAAYARLFDITVIGVHEETADAGQHHIEIYPDRVAYDSGRPVIIFPSGYRDGFFKRRAVVAWDGGRAAARALADAMQILEDEDEVEIVSVGKSPLSQALPGIDVATVLDRHNVKVQLTELPKGRETIAQTLIDHCEKVGAGLLVMGAYEHSPLRESLIGGVTHDIALRAKLPVLMSH